MSTLSLTDQALIQPLLESCSVQLSEYVFANLYLFREAHKYQLIQGEELYIKGTTYDGGTFIMPTSRKSFDALITDQKAYSSVDFLFPIPEDWAASADKTIWNTSFIEADSDYVFDTQQMARYGGRGLSKKRNLVKQFTRSFQATVKPVQGNTTQDALAVLDIWKNASTGPLPDDTEACREAIVNHELLKLEGIVFYVDTQPIGFVLGEPLTADTFALHFAKADIAYKGIYPYMYQSYCQDLVDRFAFINMEQDMGRPSLRQAKNSYEPIKMCHKIRMSPITKNPTVINS